MKARLTRNYVCSPDGVNVITYQAGQIVTGQVAIYAMQDGAATEANDLPAPAEAKTPVPRTTKRGR